MSPRRGHFRKGLSSKHYFSGDIILELPAPRLWASPFTPVTMRFWNWRPWPVRGRKKTLLLSGRFGNDGIGQVPSKSQRVTVFLEWSLLTRQKSTTLKRSSGKKRCQEVRGVSLHFFGSFSTDLAKITCGISLPRSQLPKIQRSEPIPVIPSKNLGWIGSTPPQPHPPSPIHTADRFVTSLAKMKFQLHQGSRLQPSTWLGVGAPLEFGGLGCKVGVGWCGWLGRLSLLGLGWRLVVGGVWGWGCLGDAQATKSPPWQTWMIKKW